MIAGIFIMSSTEMFAEANVYSHCSDRHDPTEDIGQKRAGFFVRSESAFPSSLLNKLIQHVAFATDSVRFVCAFSWLLDFASIIAATSSTFH